MSSIVSGSTRSALERLEVKISKTLSIRNTPGACRIAALAAASNSNDCNSRAKIITIKMPPIKDMHDDTQTVNAFREMYLRGEFVDVALICADQTFHAHRTMLAAHSEVFRKGLASMPAAAVHRSRQEISFMDIAHSDAVKVMLDYLYKVDLTTWEERNSRLLQDITVDVLRLASHFQLSGLLALASRWLLAGVTTANVLDRLATCEEFQLEDMRIRILRHIAKDKDALGQVSTNKHVAQNPQLLHDLLQYAASPAPKRKSLTSGVACAPKMAPKKKARKT